jgi:hypothetical protein
LGDKGFLKLFSEIHQQNGQVSEIGFPITVKVTHGVPNPMALVRRAREQDC